MKEYIRFLWRCFRLSFVGDMRYQAWMLTLTVFALLGLNAYAKQFVYGLQVTGMTDQVSWGLYIANFTFLVGMAAAAVMLVIPVYIYKNRELHDLVIFGELLAVASIVMCMLFVVVDLGSPMKSFHLLRLNLPGSMLAWDVVVLNGYLLLNLHICGYLVYCSYRRRKPSKAFYIPFVFVAIVWAISIHTVTAFLLVGLGARHFWNSAILAPRFLASAFAAGPAFLIVTLQIVRYFSSYKVPDKALHTLKNIVVVALCINFFLLLAEVFTDFYTGSNHAGSITYLFFGIGEATALVPWIWSAVTMNAIALVILLTPAGNRMRWMNLACVLLVIGIWIEKGMGLIIPAFVPTPLGEVVEYTPTINEILVCTGIWAFGLLLYTILVRITIPVLSGELTYDREYSLGSPAPKTQNLTSGETEA